MDAYGPWSNTPYSIGLLGFGRLCTQLGEKASSDLLKLLPFLRASLTLVVGAGLKGWVDSTDHEAQIGFCDIDV